MTLRTGITVTILVKTSNVWGSAIASGAGNGAINLGMTANLFFTRLQQTPGSNEVKITTNIQGVDGPREPLVLTDLSVLSGLMAQCRLSTVV